MTDELDALLCVDHEPNTVCKECGLEVDKYGNTEDSFINCSFPDCGCAGARNCMAGEANHCANTLNLEKGRKAQYYGDIDI